MNVVIEVFVNAGRLSLTSVTALSGINSDMEVQRGTARIPQCLEYRDCNVQMSEGIRKSGPTPLKRSVSLLVCVEDVLWNVS